MHGSLPVSVSVTQHVCAQCLQRRRGHSVPLRARFPDGCELPSGCWDLTQVLQKSRELFPPLCVIPHSYDRTPGQKQPVHQLASCEPAKDMNAFLEGSTIKQIISD